MKSNIIFLIVDALNLIRRVHAASPQTALESTIQSLKRAIRYNSPTHIVAVFDGVELTWRHSLYKTYKAGRKPMPSDLKSLLDQFPKAFSQVGVESVSTPTLEADDVIATLATKVTRRGGMASILSTDKIYCQLISKSISIRNHFQRVDMDKNYVLETFGLPPSLLVDYWALAGIPSTSIPGVPGIGSKTATKLLREYGTLQNIQQAAVQDLIKGKLGQTLRYNIDVANLSAHLASLKCSLELGWNLKSFRLLSKKS